MTPQERQLVADLFDRLAGLESSPRDPDAERAIAEGLARAPHALYPLVQTVLLQDEALKRAHARIGELETGERPQESSGFLDSMREAIFGRDDMRRGPVPSVPPASKWGSGQTLGTRAGSPMQRGQESDQRAPEPGGGSFLGTAAAATAGVIGGSLLLNSFQSLMGGHHGSALASPSAGERPSPWGSDDAARSELAREAGADDVGRGEAAQRSGLFDDQNAGDTDAGRDDDFDVADAGDFGDGGDV